MRRLRRNLNSNLYGILLTVGIQVARVLHKVQPLNKLIIATICCPLKRDFAVGSEPLKCLAYESLRLVQGKNMGKNILCV
jgi:hypothetical protein